jgi:hypothetical protein
MPVGAGRWVSKPNSGKIQPGVDFESRGDQAAVTPAKPAGALETDQH